MFERINQKIEMIREEPEVIRIRYAFGLVAITMLFVIGVWILTIQQNFRETSPEIKEHTKDINAMVDETRSEIKQTTDSLEDLKQNGQSLGTGTSSGATGETFFQNQLKTQEHSEGVTGN